MAAQIFGMAEAALITKLCCCLQCSGQYSWFMLRCTKVGPVCISHGRERELEKKTHFFLFNMCNNKSILLHKYLPFAHLSTFLKEIYSLIYPFICLLIHPSIHLSTHMLLYLSIHLCSSIHPSTCLFIPSFIHSFIHPSIHSFIQPFIHASVYSSINSFTFIVFQNADCQAVNYGRRGELDCLLLASRLDENNNASVLVDNVNYDYYDFVVVNSK